MLFQRIHFTHSPNETSEFAMESIFTHLHQKGWMFQTNGNRLEHVKGATDIQIMHFNSKRIFLSQKNSFKDSQLFSPLSGHIKMLTELQINQTRCFVRIYRRV